MDDSIRPRGVSVAFGRVLISVDEADGILHLSDGSPVSYAEPIRALSLNRLDTMDDCPLPAAFAARADGHYCLYRCPSFPGLDRHLSASARTVSTTNLETDLESLSPRVSTTTLSQDLDRERFGLSVCSMPFLARSASARTIEGAPPEMMMPPVQKPIDLLVTPHVTSAAAHARRRKSCVRVVYRSVSCPALAEGGRCHAGAWVYRRRPVLRSQSPRGDVNLEGEEIKDLPIALRGNYPDFAPEFPDGIGYSKITSTAQRHCPSFARGDRDGSLPVNPVVTTPRPGAEARHLASALKNYVNVGDVPSSFARPIFVDEQQKAPRLVQIKCLQWLNSLDGNR